MKKYVIATLACILLIVAYVVERKDVAQQQTPEKLNTSISSPVT